MQSGSTSSDVCNFDNSLQQRIQERLRLVGPGPAAFYRDACQLMAKPHLLESTSHIVAHLLREIESSIRDVLEPIADADAIAKQKTANSKQGHRAEITAILLSTGISLTDPVAISWLRLAKQDSDYALHARAHRHHLLQPRSVDEEFVRFWNEMQSILDMVLERFEAKYLSYFGLLDELMRKPVPYEADVKMLIGSIPSNLVTLRYFFGSLQYPGWLRPLMDAGLFSHAPTPIIARHDGTVYHEYWPQVEYLKRVAVQEPEAVCEVIKGMPDSAHGRVYAELIQAITQMPPSIACGLVAKVSAWIRSPDAKFITREAGRLIVQWAAAGYVEDAMALANELLGILPSPQLGGKMNKRVGARPRRNPDSRLDTWQYEQILKTSVVDASVHAGIPILAMLCRLLSDALRQEYGRSRSRKDVNDYSYIWREDIEDDSNHHYDEVRNPLISAIRDVGDRLVASRTATEEQVLEELETCRFMVCRRLAMRFLCVWDDPSPELVIRYLTDESLFRAIVVEREYALLLKQRFGMLPEADQQTILGWIAQGPNYRERSEEAIGRWQRDWLSLTVPHLPNELNAKYEALVLALGTAVMPDTRGFTHSSWVGPTSPVATDSLGTMSVDEIINYLNTWVPSGYPPDPSPEGLGRALSEAVASDPIRFAESAGSFAILQEPTYISSLFSGFQSAVRQGRPFPWNALMDLATDIVTRPRDIPGRSREKDHDRDPHWGWSRKEIARLLRDAFLLTKGGIPVRLRSKVWGVLEVLVSDPDPTSEDEAVYGGGNQGPANMSLNTVRGTAMHAVIHYAIWLRRRMDKKENKNELIARGFDAMPEVRKMLDDHLDPSLDPALTVRAVYGWWFPQLVLLDSTWARAHAGKVFPEDDSQRQYWQAAWDSYLLFGQLYGSVYDALVEQYRTAVARSGTVTGQDGKPSESDERLGKHLVTIYWWGRIGLDEMAQFFSMADPRLRADAISYAGQSLRAESKRISDERLRSLENLWVNRLEAAKSMSSEDCRTELSAFGWWAISGRFDEDWALERFGETLSLAGWAEPDDDVIKWLADLAPRMPLFAVECLVRMAEGDRQGWGISHSWHNEIRSIVAVALSSTDNTAKRRATDLVNWLGARGLLQYRDLLDPASPE